MRLTKFIKNLLRPVKGKFQVSGDTVRLLTPLTPMTSIGPDDVIIVGFPKSGNTLMQHIMAHLVYGVNERATRSMVELLCPDMYRSSHFFRFGKSCYFKSHDLPEPHYRKVIYIMRDGREALLSFYHMNLSMGRTIPLDQIYTGAYKPFPFVSWAGHIRAWEANPHKADILWLRFEDLLSDKMSALQQICDFLELERTDDDLQRVCDFTSLEHMKDIEALDDWQQMQPEGWIKGSSFVRKGATGSFKQEVDPALIGQFTRENHELLKSYYPERLPANHETKQPKP